MHVNLQVSLVRSGLERIKPFLPQVEALYASHILLTGATGFFGKWLLALVDLLNEDGANIRVTAVSRSPEAFLGQQPYYRNVHWLHWIKSDTSELKLKPPAHFDYLIHAATETSAAAHQDPLFLFESMLQGARQVLEVAVQCGVKRVMFTGSGAQYGALPEGQQCFADDALQACDSTMPGSAYGEAKRVQETLAALYSKRHGIDVVFARCFAFVGPGLSLDGHFAIGNFIRDALWRECLVLNSRGEALRSYLYAADLAVWLFGLLAAGQSGQAYNVGSDQALSIADLARRVGGWLAPAKPVLISDVPSSGPRSVYVPSIEKARALGLQVWTPLECAVKETAQWADTESDVCNEISGVEDKR